MSQPTPEEILAALAKDCCPWCGTITTKDGKPMQSWGMHINRMHGVTTRELRSMLELTSRAIFCSQSLSDSHKRVVLRGGNKRLAKGRAASAKARRLPNPNCATCGVLMVRTRGKDGRLKRPRKVCSKQCHSQRTKDALRKTKEFIIGSRVQIA